MLKSVRSLPTALLAALATAAATPALPAPALAAQAVREALAPEVAPAPVVAAAPVARPQSVPVQPTAAQTRAQAIEQAQEVLAQRTRTGRSVIARATAYNSLAAQTDSTPFITATGTRTRPGVVALSRDLLRMFPYGSRITIEDLSGKYNHLLKGRVFYVEDTMAARKTNSIDIWMGTRSQALQFGARQVRITAVR
ncbi:3D domain-containing protein [Deinococcus sp. NW-56]|uniref:3D domain-containing protein n=1 Tax=Deinococcus sp. NW-56 TaxID=2080419 RepID=UPI000CF3F74F|nr:3D domain-containing protein [Deinococcus sp. NW-56]